MFQTTQAAIDLYRVGFYSVLNMGLEKMDAKFLAYVGGTINTKQAWEQFAVHAGLGLFQQRDEGGLVKIDGIPQRYRFRITPVLHSLGLKYTKQSQQKDIYGFIRSQGALLAQSANATHNLMAANAFINLAFPGGSSLAADGLTIFNTAHTTVSSTTQNNAGTAAMSYFALEDALTSIRTQTHDRDDIPRMVNGGFKLIVPPAVTAAATRAVQSAQIAGTNANDTSKYVSSRVVEIVEDQWIGYQMPTMKLAWALIPANNSENKNMFLQVDPLRTIVEYKGEIDSMMMYAHFEDAMVNLGWQGQYGSKP